jgi:hypothetical protein
VRATQVWLDVLKLLDETSGRYSSNLPSIRDLAAEAHASPFTAAGAALDYRNFRAGTRILAARIGGMSAQLSQGGARLAGAVVNASRR